ncbi:MAG: carboxypeptidase-like regulatory domain-containing protein [Candidatus Sumerlaeota bacterium]|nr:carboxypeptidase-like regulatory domain-containing protein [Candidatus Sumerlaeota bacterium]
MSNRKIPCLAAPISIFILSFISSLIACRSNHSAKEALEIRTLEIRGRVTDQSGATVRGALVEWGGVYDLPKARDRTATDADGRYCLRVKRLNGKLRLGVSAKGFSPDWVDYCAAAWTFSKAHGPDVSAPKKLDFVLEPAHQLQGVVVEVEGPPIPDALVKAQTIFEMGLYNFSTPRDATMIPGDSAFETKTDKDGTFRFEGLPAEGVFLTVTSPYRHVNAKNYAVDAPCRIVMSGSGQQGHIRARVVDRQTGKPVQDFILARRHDPAQLTIHNSDGRYEENGKLTEGADYHRHVYARGYAPWQGRIKATPLSSDEVFVIELSPAPPLRGRLLDANSKKPVARAPMIAALMNRARYFDWNDWDKYIDGYHSLNMVQRATTDRDGQFWFCEDRDDRGALIIITPGYARTILRPEERPAVDSDGLLTIALQPESSIQGMVRENGRVLGGATMDLWKKHPQQFEEWFEKAKADAKGRFEFNRLSPGDYRVRIQRQLRGDASITSAIATVTLGQQERKNLGWVEIPVDAKGKAIWPRE